MSEALLLSIPLAFGLALATPRKHKPTIFTLAAMGAGSGLLGIVLAREGDIESAMMANIALVIFDLLSTAKIFEII